jgi:hypothetical protein
MIGRQQSAEPHDCDLWHAFDERLRCAIEILTRIRESWRDKRERSRA